MTPDERMRQLRKLLAQTPGALFEVEKLYDTLVSTESARDYWHREALRFRVSGEAAKQE